MGNKVKYDTPYEWFLDTVVNGYKREMAGGTVNVMPGQGDVVDVMKNIDGIYGYRIYHQNCHVCHGKAARGSSFAPNLLDSYNYAKKGEKMGNKQKYDTQYDWFLDTVVNGYKREMAGGTVNVMPAHGEVVDVMTNIDGIFGYIAAMADGKLTTTNRPGKGWKIK